MLIKIFKMIVSLIISLAGIISLCGFIAGDLDIFNWHFLSRLVILIVSCVISMFIYGGLTNKFEEN